MRKIADCFWIVAGVFCYLVLAALGAEIEE